MGRHGLAIAGLLLVAGAALLADVAPRQGQPWWTSHAAITRGARDVATGSCISCHPLAGVSEAGAAVDLTHVGRRRTVPWLLHELAHPTSARPPIPPGQLRDIAAYLANLR